MKLLHLILTMAVLAIIGLPLFLAASKHWGRTLAANSRALAEPATRLMTLAGNAALLNDSGKNWRATP